MIDSLILGVDKALRTLCSTPPASQRVPDSLEPAVELNVKEKNLAAALMRVNHAGEVCAQALYQGQALTSRNDRIRLALEGASDEEFEHLAWTERRLEELGGHKSILNPFWYLGAFSLGAFAGALGDGWSLGFLAETERQVEAHLERHLLALPVRDSKSRAIVEKIKLDERSHAEMAVRLGARELPLPAKRVMSIASRFMTRAAFLV